MPEISVIVPVYQAENCLEHCVSSILAQTFTDFELILVDDGSKDGSGNLCESYAKRDNRAIVIHQENGGSSCARNAGLERASGDYVSFVDADDWIEPHMLERLRALLIQYGADFSMCDYTCRDSKAGSAPTHTHTLMNFDDMMRYFFRTHGEKSNYSVCGKLFTKFALREFRFLEGRINEDVDASFRIYRQCSLCVSTPEKMYHYIQNPKGITRNGFSQRDFDLLFIWDNIVSVVAKEMPQYYDYALINRKRADFTLLVKMERAYFSGNRALRKTCREYQSVVRANRKELLQWNMSLSRKILLQAVCLLPIL